MKPSGDLWKLRYPALGSNFGYGNFTAARAVGYVLALALRFRFP